MNIKSILSTGVSTASTFLSPFKLYLFGAAFLLVFGAGLHFGAGHVHSAWDKEIAKQAVAQQVLDKRIIDLQGQISARDAAAARADAEASAAAAQARAVAAAESARLQTRLGQLTRDLANQPQYQACKLDPQTLDELNRSLK